MEIPGYNIIRKDQASNSKHGGVCIYSKNALPLKLISTKNLQEWITFEITIWKNCCKFMFLYRSPSQTNGEFESLLKKFEQL